jgi:hypothetical protein
MKTVLAATPPTPSRRLYSEALAEKSDLGLSLALDNVRSVLNSNPPRILVHDDEKFI